MTTAKRLTGQKKKKKKNIQANVHPIASIRKNNKPQHDQGERVHVNALHLRHKERHHRVVHGRAIHVQCHA